MNARQFMDKYGIPATEDLCLRAGTELVYFDQLARGWRKPSPEMAQRLAVASGGELDVISLLQIGVPHRKPLNPRGRNTKLHKLRKMRGKNDRVTDN